MKRLCRQRISSRPGARASARRASFVAFASAALLLAACEPPSEPTLGNLRVSVATTGGDLPLDGYRVSVNGRGDEPISPNGSLVVAGVAPGPYVVELRGVAENCTVAEDAVRQTDVTAGDTTTVAFAVGCVATGLVITVRTGGLDPDQDGYGVTLDGGAAVPVAVNGGVTISRLSAGAHTVTLTGLAANCSVSGGTSRSVSLDPGEMEAVGFAVTCAAVPPVLRVTTATTGADTDPDGYTVTISGPDFLTNRQVGVSETFAIAGLVPGDYTVTLDGVSINCDVTSPNPRTALVAPSGTVIVAFDVACSVAAMLAIVINDDIYSVKLSNANLTQLTHSAAASDPAWSPDGRKLAFTSRRDGNAEIYLMDADGQNHVRLTSSDADDSQPEWSPDGTRLAFTSTRDGNAEIYLMDAGGQNQVRLTSNDVNDSDPAWSPDGATLAFTSSRSGNAEIYVMNAGGQNQVRLTSNDVDDSDPAWSPHGTKLAFTSGSRIYRMDADGQNQVQLTSGEQDSDPAWSPDGAWIAFQGWTCSGWDFDCNPYAVVFLMRADGSRRTWLMGDAFQPAWRR